MKYSKEQLQSMRDHIINEILAKLLGLMLMPEQEAYSETAIVYNNGTIDPDYLGTYVDYCHNSSDIMPLAFEHNISLSLHSGKPEAMHLDHELYWTRFQDDNPLRAVACCLILVLQQRNEEKEPERKLNIDMVFSGVDEQAMQRTPLSGETISNFIDSKGGASRTTKAIAGRLVEEIVELALACGLSTSEITHHIQDAIHNQCLKASKQRGHTVFPSQLIDDEPDLAGEIADVSIILKDLAYRASVNLHAEEWRKWQKFTQKQFSVSSGGTLYTKKDHVTLAKTIASPE